MHNVQCTENVVSYDWYIKTKYNVTDYNVTSMGSVARSGDSSIDVTPSVRLQTQS